MEKNGFLVCRGAIHNSELKQCLDTYDGDIVDYASMKHFIDNIFMDVVGQQYNKLQGATYVKFRFSDNNNVDATFTHRDVYNNTSVKLELFTCLIYFDEGTIEVLPGSHLGAAFFTQALRIDMKPGDVLIFYANLMHRGIFENRKRRRLLQVFDVGRRIPRNFVQIMHQKSNSLGAIEPLKRMGLIPLMNSIIYVVDYFNLKYVLTMTDPPPWQMSGTLVSYVPGAVQYDLKPGVTNINIICRKTEEWQPSNFYKWILLFLVIVVILYMTFRFYAREKKSNQVRRKENT
jgi:hypothetical protein